MLIELNRFLTTEDVRVKYGVPDALADRLLPTLPVDRRGRHPGCRVGFTVQPSASHDDIRSFTSRFLAHDLGTNDVDTWTRIEMEREPEDQC